jgi:hypothetical protein
MGLDKSESPTPLVPAHVRGAHDMSNEAGPSNPHRASKQSVPKSQKSSRESSVGSASQVGHVKPRPPMLSKDVEKTAGALQSPRQDSVVDHFATFDSKEEKALVKKHAFQILVCRCQSVVRIS